MVENGASSCSRAPGLSSGVSGPSVVNPSDRSEGRKNGPGRPKTLHAWKWYEVGEDTSGQKKAKAICIACKAANPTDETAWTTLADTKTLMERHVFECVHIPTADKMDLRQHLANAVSDIEDDQPCPKRAKLPRATSTEVNMRTYFQEIGPGVQRKFEAFMTQFFALHAIPFRAVECPQFQGMLKCLDQHVKIPGREKLATSLLQMEKFRAIEIAKEKMKHERNLTVCFDSWTEQFGKAAVLGVNVVLPSDKSVYLLGAIDMSDVRHTADNSLPRLLECLQFMTRGQLAAVCSDDAADMRLLRQKVTDMPEYRHVLSVRCQMHAFSLVVKSLLAHEWAASLVKKASSIVTFFRDSTFLHSRLMSIANAGRAKPVPGLASAGSTRMTSVSTMLESLRGLKTAIACFVERGAEEPDMRIVPTDSKLASLVKDLLENHHDQFFLEMGLLADLLLPFSKVVMAIQGSWSTLADVTRYWLYLAQALTGLLPRLPNGYAKHVATEYNRRARQLNSNLCRLALLLHPCFREKAAPGMAIRELVRHGIDMMSYRTDAENALLLADKIRSYVDRAYPYNEEFVGDSWDVAALKRWWRRTGQPGKCVLVSLAFLMLDISCTSASTERVFSITGWMKPKTRNRMSVETLEAITAIKLAHQSDANTRRATMKTPREAQSLDVCVDIPSEENDGDEDHNIAQAIESLAEQEKGNEDATDPQMMLEAPEGMSFVELLTGNWDGFDMGMEGYEPGTHPPGTQTKPKEALPTGRLAASLIESKLSALFP